MASDRVLIIAGLLATAAALVGLGLLVAAPLFPLALVAAAIAGGAGVLVEIQADTSLQRQIPEEVFGRAYGFVLPACFAAIILGSAAAPVLDDILGLSGAFIAVGVLAAGYALWVALPERGVSGKLGA
jgi:predicted MFS family arabinose efflux permease